jgi:hypothetical protein
MSIKPPLYITTYTVIPPPNFPVVDSFLESTYTKGGITWYVYKSAGSPGVLSKCLSSGFPCIIRNNLSSLPMFTITLTNDAVPYAKKTRGEEKDVDWQDQLRKWKVHQMQKLLTQ